MRKVDPKLIKRKNTKANDTLTLYQNNKVANEPGEPPRKPRQRANTHLETGKNATINSRTMSPTTLYWKATKRTEDQDSSIQTTGPNTK